jgi:hypothetical protein
MESDISTKLVMPGLVPGIHVLAALSKKAVDGRDRPGQDEKANRDEGPLNPRGEERGNAARLEP